MSGVRSRRKQSGDTVDDQPSPPPSASSPEHWLFASERNVWALAVVFRAVNALLVRTYFNPDEHWQSLEVAHRVVFGYGHLTWEWKQGIRGYIHPLIFALLYKMLALLHLDKPWIMVMAPRLLQSVFASVGDLYLYKLSKLVFDGQVARWAFFSSLLNWFMFFCITRTLSSSLETVLTVIGLYYWMPFIILRRKNGPSVAGKSFSSEQNCTDSRKLALLMAALTCALRPTSAVTWMYVGLWDLTLSTERLSLILLDVIPTGTIVLAVSTFLDRLMYGSWVIVPLNFLKFNFLSSGGDYYGTHVFHWYFTQGFPSMVGTFLPFSVIGIIRAKERVLAGLILWTLCVYSLLGHKEFRFVLPVLPITLMFSGYCLADMSRCGSYDKRGTRGTNHKLTLNISLLVLVITNVPMAFYMSSVHQRGTEDVMFYLSKEAHDGKVESILFLMPCHSTPYYSTLHYNLPMRFLDCTPSNYNGTLDESDQFLTNPVDFAADMFEHSYMFSHIILFDCEETKLRTVLSQHSYYEVKRFFYAHFKVDRDLQSSVAVYAHGDHI